MSLHQKKPRLAGASSDHRAAKVRRRYRCFILDLCLLEVMPELPDMRVVPFILVDPAP